ncbi:unnamed protein product [Musa acuminata var. zebrina]
MVNLCMQPTRLITLREMREFKREEHKKEDSTVIRAEFFWILWNTTMFRWQLLQLLLELCFFVSELGILTEDLIALSHGTVEIIEEPAVCRPEMGNLRPQLAELLQLAHARSPRGLSVGYHPPLPPLLGPAQSLLFRLDHAVVWKADFMHQRRALSLVRGATSKEIAQVEGGDAVVWKADFMHQRRALSLVRGATSKEIAQVEGGGDAVLSHVVLRLARRHTRR